MQSKLLDIPKYLNDYIRYYGVNRRMFWFQKFKRLDWIYGQNFGDYLSYVIVGELLKQKGLLPIKRTKTKQRLLALGSIMHYAKVGDVIWGSGVNGKMPLNRYQFDKLDVRMIRGPLTRDFLLKLGVNVKETVYGDPALLLPILFPLLKPSPKKGKKIVLPNFNELTKVSALVSEDYQLVSPVGYWENIVSEILTSELVLTSSLHGLIVAEIFNVPVRFVSPCGGETLFKYNDYLAGTGRDSIIETVSFLGGISDDMGVELGKPSIDTQSMINAFPYDIFK